MEAVRKIVIIGPESTGKSTLSKALAEKLQTVWNPEFARKYLDELGENYQESDLFHIAIGQIASEDALLTQANKLLICDTDLYVIKVWAEAKYGKCDPRILQLIATRTYDFYLLTDIDIPWTEDPLREHPEPSQRQYFHKQYCDLVQESGLPWACINGDEASRLTKALAAIQLFTV